MFRFTAPITMGNASASLAACVQAVDRGETEIGLDALPQSDSSALAVLLAVLRHAALTGKTLRLSGIPAAVESLAKLYGVDGLLPTAPAAPVLPA